MEVPISISLSIGEGKAAVGKEIIFHLYPSLSSSYLRSANISLTFSLHQTCESSYSCSTLLIACPINLSLSPRSSSGSVILKKSHHSSHQLATTSQQQPPPPHPSTSSTAAVSTPSASGSVVIRNGLHSNGNGRIQQRQSGRNNGTTDSSKNNADHQKTTTEYQGWCHGRRFFLSPQQHAPPLHRESVMPPSFLSDFAC